MNLAPPDVLTLALLLLAAALVWAVARQGRGEAQRRRDDQAFALGAIERALAKNAQEVAAAEAIRLAAQREDEREVAVATELGPELAEQMKQGYTGDLAMARAMIRKAGGDPDDDETVARWNRRIGAQA